MKYLCTSDFFLSSEFIILINNEDIDKMSHLLSSRLESYARQKVIKFYFL